MKQLPPGPWMYTGALENYPRLIDRLAKTRHLLGTCGEQLRAVRNPFVVAKTLRDAELPYPECRTFENPPAADGTWLLKPRRSAGGFGIQPWTAQLQPAGKDHYFQRRIEGTPIAAVFLGNTCEAVLLGITQQLTATSWAHAEAFQYAGSIGPLPLSETATDEFRRIGNVLCQQFSLTGLFGVDAILYSDRIVPVEINPRYPASVEVLERVSDWSAVGLHVQACLDGDLPGDLSRTSIANTQACCGKAILYAPQHLTIDEALHRHLMENRGNPRHPLLADIPTHGTDIPSQRPVLTVFAEGPSPAEVIESLKSRAATIYSQLRQPSS